ncbi:hypothetical protein [Flavisolibacter nicotianae]|uniref:hypothetical protein n=1 Tax=Flavisolibacter nicotianae TaxID=2364882 RepID=UPI000EAFAA1A|nr:hypothetical protein [Flavisolibacter nicotianae]
MKNIKFLLGLLTVVLIMTSCVTTQGAADDEYLDTRGTQRIGNRVYMQDPYYGTVVLERDPYTGRYYDVTYGSGYGTGYSRSYPYGGYNRGYNRSYSRGGGVYQRGGTVQQAPSREEIRQNRDEARRKVLGN